MWPFDHTFATYHWPGVFGWYARGLNYNLIAGFLQIGVGFLLGYGMKKTGALERAKNWAVRDLHDNINELHMKADHIIFHHPDIPEIEK